MNFKKAVILISLTGTLGLESSQVSAAGFELLPTTGASVYISCRSGNGLFETFYPPLADSSCVAPKGVGTSLLFGSIPEAGFTLVALQSFSSPITAFAENLATLNERVWRNASSNECIYGKQVIMSSLPVHDYNSYNPGTDYMEVNDFAFGGYTGVVSAAYAKPAVNFTSVIRIGRTFTSVQRQTNTITTGVCPGFLHLPSIGGILGTEINGVGAVSTCSVLPTPSQQEAPLSASWVNFTTYASAGMSPDGLAVKPSSPNMYIKQACSSSTTTLVANSMKLRQTGRVYQPWVVVTASSRAPSSSIAP